MFRRWQYAFSFVLYVALSVANLALRDNLLLLNWIVGPLFPLVVLHAIPTGVRTLRARLAAR